MLVLKGNNPRFPWETSFAMLSYRLTGTTGSSAFYRDGQADCTQLAAAVLIATKDDRDARIFARHGEPVRALGCCPATACPHARCLPPAPR